LPEALFAGGTVGHFLVLFNIEMYIQSLWLATYDPPGVRTS